MRLLPFMVLYMITFYVMMFINVLIILCSECICFVLIAVWYIVHVSLCVGVLYCNCMYLYACSCVEERLVAEHRSLNCFFRLASITRDHYINDWNTLPYEIVLAPNVLMFFYDRRFDFI